MPFHRRFCLFWNNSANSVLRLLTLSVARLYYWYQRIARRDAKHEGMEMNKAKKLLATVTASEGQLLVQCGTHSRIVASNGQCWQVRWEGKNGQWGYIEGPDHKTKEDATEYAKKIVLRKAAAN